MSAIVRADDPQWSGAHGVRLRDWDVFEIDALVACTYSASLDTVLSLPWQDKTGEKETMLPVPRLARQFGEDCPDNVNDCEQVRRWTLGWPKEALVPQTSNVEGRIPGLSEHYATVMDLGGVGHGLWAWPRPAMAAVLILGALLMGLLA